MRVDYEATFPAELRPAVDALVARYQEFVPKRVRNVLIRLENSDNDAEASTEQRLEYGFAILFLHAGWLRLDAYDRERIFIHELVAHAILEPMVAYADDVMRSFVQDEATRAFVGDRWKVTYEQVVDEMAEALLLSKRGHHAAG